MKQKFFFFYFRSKDIIVSTGNEISLTFWVADNLKRRSFQADTEQFPFDFSEGQSDRNSHLFTDVYL